jgi:prevent-host-death family protein
MDVASRELRNRTRALLDLVAAGESVTITVDGRRVAALVPLEGRPTWASRHWFVRLAAANHADPALAADLRALAADTTDDVPWP